MKTSFRVHARRAIELSFVEFLTITIAAVAVVLMLGFGLMQQFRADLEDRQDHITKEAIRNVFQAERNAVNLEVLRLSLDTMAKAQDYEVARIAYIRAWGILADASVQTRAGGPDGMQELRRSVQLVWAERKAAKRLRDEIADHWQSLFKEMLTVAAMSHSNDSKSIQKLNALAVTTPLIGAHATDFLVHLQGVRRSLNVICLGAEPTDSSERTAQFKGHCTKAHGEAVILQEKLWKLIDIRRGFREELSVMERHATSYRRAFTQIEHTSLLTDIRDMTGLADNLGPYVTILILSAVITTFILFLGYFAVMRPVRAATASVEDFMKDNVVPERLPFSLIKEINLLLDWVLIFCRNMHHERAKATQMVGRYEALRAKAQMDPVTGVANRQSFEELIAENPQARANTALMMVDCDHFKDINDTLGHPFGDRLLRVVAETLQRTLAESDLVFRYGGDEFCLVLTDVTPKTLESMAERLNRQIRRVSRDTAVREDTEAENPVTLSIGVSTIAPEDDARDLVGLLREADLALYVAKEAGRNTHRHYKDKGVFTE